MDAEARVPLSEMFARLQPPFPVAELPRRLPREFDAAGWIFRIRVFLIEAPDGVALIDAGMGPAWSGLARKTGTAGRLPELLAQVGVKTESVDHVVLTHFHSDHVGWAIADESGRPTFPRARYHLNPADLKAAEALGRTDPYDKQYWRQTFRPLRDSGQLEFHDGEDHILDSVRIVQSPGHTPGHLSVRIDDDEAVVLCTGDLLHLSYQLQPPFVSDPFDMSLEAAQRSRSALLTGLAGEARKVLLASPHLPDPFTSWAEHMR
jgi:glyoxylase-like metal-dependent hydrolase (beta-lactamase superfamily II)